MLRGFLIVVLFFVISVANAANPLDSIGVEKKKGKTYIVHKVEAKETLYSLSRKYGVSVEEIKNANEDVKDLKVGQTLLIPVLKQPASNNATEAKSANENAKTHKVEPKETLYSIARKYGVNIEDLKKANPGVNELKVGQVIVIPGVTEVAKEQERREESLPEFYKVQPKESYYSISKKFGIKVEEIKRLNPGISELKVGQKIRLSGTADSNTDATNIETAEEKAYEEKQETSTSVKRPDAGGDKKNYVSVKEPKLITAPENNVPTFSNLKKDGYTKVNESGFAELYLENSGFHYALHKTAPVGTIIYVVNEENGQKVYVRVMGKLTDAGSGVLIKISPKAFEKISKGTTKVKVSLTYIP